MKKMFLMLMVVMMNAAVANAQQARVQNKKAVKKEVVKRDANAQADQLAKEMKLNNADKAKFCKIFKEYKKERADLRMKNKSQHWANKGQGGKRMARGGQFKARNDKFKELDAKYRKQFSKVLNDKQIAYVMGKAGHHKNRKDMHKNHAHYGFHRMHKA